MIRRAFLKLLAFAPAVTAPKWARSEPMNFPDGEQLQPFVGMKAGGDSEFTLEWWPAIQPWYPLIVDRDQIFIPHKIGNRYSIGSLFHAQLILACQLPEDPLYNVACEYVRRFRPVSPFGEHEWIVEVVA